MTAFYGVLDLNSGLVQYANAAHPTPRRRCAAGDVEPVSAVGGPPQGVGLSAGYAQASFTLEQGDALVLYTDGLTEACNDKGEAFGASRLDAALRDAPSLDPGALVCGVVAARDEFLAGARVQDDVTLLAIARALPAGAAPGPGTSDRR
jgi:sigma-B regulation protein RsbU (phosphoserine phosphatase)